MKGDGDPTCFTNIVDTGIPELQKWCHSLTVSSRERATRAFLTHLKTFATSVKAYVEGIGDVTEMDRQTLREKWESSLLDEDEDEDEDEDDPMGYGGGWASSDIDMGGLTLDGFGGSIFGTGLYTIPRKAPKVDRYGELVGTTPRLIKVSCLTYFFLHTSHASGFRTSRPSSRSVYKSFKDVSEMVWKRNAVLVL